MDLEQKIRQLEIQKRKIELAIAELEQLQGIDVGGGVLTNRRGRKSMGSEERFEVSERMKRYWANRREQLEQVKERTTSRWRRWSDTPCRRYPTRNPVQWRITC